MKRKTTRQTAKTISWEALTLEEKLALRDEVMDKFRLYLDFNLNLSSHVNYDFEQDKFFLCNDKDEKLYFDSYEQIEVDLKGILTGKIVILTYGQYKAAIEDMVNCSKRPIDQSYRVLNAMYKSKE